MRQSVWGLLAEDEIKHRERSDAAGNAIDYDALLCGQIAPSQADAEVVLDHLSFLDLAVVANHLIEVPFPAMPEKDGEPFKVKTRIIRSRKN